MKWFSDIILNHTKLLFVGLLGISLFFFLRNK